VRRFREDSSLIFILFGGLVFLFPLAVYLLFLAFLNGRHRPTLISGTWDFCGVLFALSGFVLVGGPWILSGVNEQLWRSILVEGQASTDRVWKIVWWILPIGYFLAVLAGAAFVLWCRRLVSVVYNCEAPLLIETLFGAIHNLGLAANHIGNRVAIRYSASVLEEPTKSERFQTAIVEIDAFRVMRHISLRWRAGDDWLWRDLNAEMSRALARTEVPPNPIAGWLLTGSSCLFGIILFGLGLLIFLGPR
jgi:hypothetical protein